jgi:hypothetical protein
MNSNGPCSGHRSQTMKQFLIEAITRSEKRVAVAGGVFNHLQ